jgi:ABC-2 type transport system permease protein
MNTASRGLQPAVLQATPLRSSELVIGYAIAFSIIGMLQTVVLLAIGVTVFNIMIVGNIFLAFLVMALLAIVSLSLWHTVFESGKARGAGDTVLRAQGTIMLQ